MFDITGFIELMLEEVVINWAVLFGGLILAFLLGRLSQRRFLKQKFKQHKNLLTQLKQQSSHILAILGEESDFEGFEEEISEDYHQAQTHNAADIADDDVLSETKVYVGNVDYNATEDELADHFAHFGEIEFVNIPIHRHTHRARGFGFIAFKTPQAAEAAIALDDTEFRGRQIQVNFAKER